MDRVRESYRRLHRQLWRSLLVYCGDPTLADEVEIDTFVLTATRVMEGGHPGGDGEGAADDLDASVWQVGFDLAAAARAGERDPGSDAQPTSVTLIDAGAPSLVELIEAFNVSLDVSLNISLDTSLDTPPDTPPDTPLDLSPDRRRAIAVLRSVGDLTPDEIADVLSVPLKTVAVEFGGAAPVLPADRLEQIHELDPPDLWPRIATRAATTSPLGRRRRRSLTVVLLVLLVTAVSAALYWLATPTTGSVTAPAATREPSPEVLRDGDAEGAGDDNPAAGSEQLVDPLRSGGASLAGSTGPALPLVLTVEENGAAVYDLRLPSGERFRLSLPARLRTELDRFFPQTPPGVIQVTGPGQTDLRIAFTFCAGQDTMAPNRSGSLVARAGLTTGSIRFCRPDELLVTTVTTDVDLDDEALQAFDMRPVELDAAYHQHVRMFAGTPTFAGPLRIGSVIVNAVGPGRVSAVDADDLSERWSYAASSAASPAASSAASDSSDGGRDVHLLAPSIAGPLQGVRGVHDGVEGVWLAEAGQGIVNLDPETGTTRWRLGLDGQPGGVWGAPRSPWFVWSSFTDEGDNRPPVLHRVDPDTGAVLWRVEGRNGADWGLNPLAATDAQVFAADVFTDPDTSSNGAGSVISGYDADDGELDFAVTIDAPDGVLTRGPLVQVLTIDDETMLLSLTTHGLLSRIDLPGGGLRWSSRVNPGVPLGPAQIGDGTWAMRVQASPSGPYYVDISTGARLSNVQLPDPPAECRPQYGLRVAVMLGPPEGADGGAQPNGATAAADCVVVAETQSVKIWNKGFEPVVLGWLNRRDQIGPDEYIELTSVGGVLPAGPNIIDVEPYPDVTVWVMAADASPTAGFRRTERSFGPIEVGMTVPEASQATGLDLELIAFDTSKGCLVVTGDPYSPLFRTEASAAGLIITAIDPPGGVDPGDAPCG